MNKKVMGLFVGLVFALSASIAKATFISGGGSIGSADLVAVQVSPLSVDLASPALVLATGDYPTPSGSGTLVVDWTEGYNDTLLAIFTGPLTANLFADVILQGTFGDPNAWSLIAFNGSTRVFLGGGASGGLGASDIPDLSSTTRADYDAILASVPEPATLALMTIGLVGIGFARKKKQS